MTAMMRPARGFSLQMLLVAVLLFKGTSALAVSKSNFKPTSIAAIASRREHTVTSKLEFTIQVITLGSS